MPVPARRNRTSIILFFVTILGLVASARAADDKRDALWTAVRAGDVKAIQAAIDKGADVNAKNEIGVSALWIAASKGKLPVIELLVKKGADVNVRDGIWYGTPLTMSE
jgi:ankyrin repeat protein